MSKNQKIKRVKPYLAQILPSLKISNSAAYGNDTGEPTSITAALGAAAVAKAKRWQQDKTKGIRNGVNSKDWIEMGDQLWHSASGRAANPVDAVCDTCSGLVLYILSNRIPNFQARVELVADKSTHHHFIVVDRALKSNIKNCRTWGKDCFVIDLWQAKFAGNETTRRGLGRVAHHYLHGIYRNPQEHIYSQNNGPMLQVDQVYDMIRA